MKQKDLKPCSSCGKGVMHNGCPVFYRLKFETFGVMVDAVRRQTGMEMMLGGGAAAGQVAHVMGLDEDMAKLVTEKELTFCMDCMMEINVGHFLE